MAARVLSLAAARLAPGAAAVICTLACLLCQRAAASALSLALENDSGQTLAVFPVKNGDIFAIRYIHSVAQTPVADFFVVKDGEIWLDSTVYQDFGAGLPHAPEKGQRMTCKRGNIIISGYNRRLPEFALRVGRVAGHVFLPPPEAARAYAHLQGDARPRNGQDASAALRLAEFAPPGAAIHFLIRKETGARQH